MAKILLIEDRMRRQELFMKETGIDLLIYSDILDNLTDGEEKSVLSNDFDFKQYSYIIAHKSAFNDKNIEYLNKLQTYCEENDKPLILFSGGLSVNYYTNDGYKKLEINSKTFYSQNLKLFLKAFKKQIENILMLCYGENWQLNIVLNILENTDYFINNHQENEKLTFSDFTEEVDINLLTSINYNFYTLNVKNDYIQLNDVKKFRDNIYQYITKPNLKDSLISKTLLIHNYNIDIESFNEEVWFDIEGDIDSYISKEIIPQIDSIEADVIFIKDNLSSNYLELYGLRVAYHIRLSQELGDRRYLPIVIISDLDSHTLNKLEPMANILFTKNIFIVKNTEDAINDIIHKEFKNLTENEYMEFLEYIKIEQPKDYLSHHSIANEWAIYKWADSLGVESDSLKINKENISSMLYFKYLIAKHTEIKDENIKKISIQKSTGKILFIDDEWNKGWSDILNAWFEEQVETFKYDYKDKTNSNLYMQIQKKVRESNPDVVILDLRLSQTDHDENMNIDDFSGIRILKMIHEINAGIQVIMLSATSKSTILEKLYDYKILGYIKKEHPDDISISTQENINKLTTLVKSGFENSYLKEVYDIKRYIADELNENPFTQYGIVFSNEDENEINYLLLLKNNIEYIFNILNTTIQNRYNYAMVSIATSLETMVKIFLYEKTRGEHLYFWDNTPVRILSEKSKLEDKILKIVVDRFGCKENISLGELIKYRNDYMHSNKNIKENKILEWLKTYKIIITSISKPIKYEKYDENKKKEKKHHNFKRD